MLCWRKWGGMQDELMEKGVQIIDGYEQFWRAHKADFPLCFELYRILLSVPATCVAVESLFMAHVDSLQRRPLYPKRLSDARTKAVQYRTWRRT
jgi:hypothetical protein